MKNKFLSLVAILMVMSMNVCAQKANKVLVAYFSATGTTAAVAEQLAKVAGGTLYAITPETAYTSADLNWNNKKSRSSVEMNDPKSRPALKGKMGNIADYEVVYIGYPIWWGVAPHIINTFIENHDLKGKTLIPFATSGGSGIAESVSVLKKSYPDLNWKEGKLLNRTSESTLREWVKKTIY